MKKLEEAEKLNLTSSCMKKRKETFKMMKQQLWIVKKHTFLWPKMSVFHLEKLWLINYRASSAQQVAAAISLPFSKRKAIFKRYFFLLLLSFPSKQTRLYWLRFAQSEIRGTEERERALFLKKLTWVLPVVSKVWKIEEIKETRMTGELG